MKKISALILISILFFSASAQQMRIGLKGAYNSTWLFNTNTSDQGELIDYVSTFGGSFGIASTYHFNDEIGLTLEILMSTHNAEYKGIVFAEPYEAIDKLSFIDIPLMFRLGPPDGGGYVEVGPQFSFLTGAEEDFTMALPGASYTGRDVKRDFSSMNIAGVLGFGYDFALAENIYCSAGLRFSYGFVDATKEFTESEFEEVDRSVASSSAHYDKDGDLNYVASHRAFGGLHVGVSYLLGR